MIRYLNHGPRNFDVNPDILAARMGWQFFAFVNGRGAPEIEGKPAPAMRAQSLWLIKPETRYQWRAQRGEVTRAVFNFTQVPELLRTLIGDADFLYRKLSAAEAKSILRLAAYLWPEYLNPTEALDLMAQRVLVELSLLFVEERKMQDRKPLNRRELDRVRRAEDFYQGNLRRNPTVEHVAQETGVSTSQLRRDFQLVYKLGPNAVFKRIRLYEAARLLANTDWTLDQIYPRAGFSSEVDFHRSFKDEYKMSPHQWRLENRTQSIAQMRQIKGLADPVMKSPSAPRKRGATG